MLRTCFARKLCCCCCACDSNLRRLDIGLLGAINVEVYLLIVRRLIASHRNNYATLHRCRMVCIYDIVTVRKATENKLSDHTDRPRYAAHIDRTPTTRRPPPLPSHWVQWLLSPPQIGIQNRAQVSYTFGLFLLPAFLSIRPFSFPFSPYSASICFIPFTSAFPAFLFVNFSFCPSFPEGPHFWFMGKNFVEGVNFPVKNRGGKFCSTSLTKLRHPIFTGRQLRPPGIGIEVPDWAYDLHPCSLLFLSCMAGASCVFCSSETVFALLQQLHRKYVTQLSNSSTVIGCSHDRANIELAQAGLLEPRPGSNVGLGLGS